MRNRNRKFLVDNIDLSGDVYNIGETWVYAPGFKKVYYYSNSNISTKAGDIDSLIPSLISRFNGGGFFSFYYRKNNNIFHITAASIHPNLDRERKTSPAGYIITAEPYDQEFLQQIKSEYPSVIDSYIDLNLSDHPVVPETISIIKTLNDINGGRIASLHVILNSQYLQEMESNTKASRFFLLFIIIIFFLTGIVLKHGILNPLKEIYKILYNHKYYPSPYKLKFISPEFLQIVELINLNRSVEIKLGNVLKEAEKQKTTAEKATKTKSEFLANIAHEIRTPMTGVLGFADMLLDSTVEPQLKELATGIKTSAETVMGIINDILDISKIKSEKFILNEGPFNINSFLDDIIWILKGFAAGRKLDIKLDNRVTRCATLYGDEKRLKQILMNLGSNAVKFTVIGGVTLTAESFPCGDDRVEITFTVSDTGIGMDENQISRLFRQYEQVHDPASFSGGTGFGLAIAKSLVDAMEGTIDIKSSPGVGSTFTVKLRMRYLEGASPKPSLITARNLGLEVLIAEDNPISMKVIGNIINKSGCRYEAVYNGTDVIKLTDLKKFDLILMDFNMPVMNGIEAASIIRSRPGPNSKTPIYGISADIIEKVKEKTKLSGMNGFISKPFRVEEVFRVLLSVKEGKHDIV